MRVRGTVARWLAAVVATAAAMVAGTTTVAPDALAGTTYTVKTASIPSGGGGAPEPGGGARITNKPYGYYIGRAVVGSRFTAMGNRQKHHWGRAHDAVNMCGWVHTTALNAHQGPGTNSCSRRTMGRLWHRRSIGTAFNYPAHVGNQPSRVRVINPRCGFYYNYFHGTRFTGGANAGHWNHPAGPIGRDKIEYRFTTLDRGAYVMRHSAYGWGFVRAGCTTRPRKLYYDND